jgi:hypothetical protein
MEPPMADRTKIRIGPGLLKIAIVGSTEPATLAATWAVAWTDLGYTEEGTVFNISPEFEDVEVAEEIDPIDILPTGRTMSVEFALAELTALNMQYALNGGTVTTGTGEKYFEPAAASATPTYVALGWEDSLTTHKERYVWRRCIQTGDIEIARRKAPDKATIGASFRVALPSTGAAFKYYVSDT